MPYIMIQDVDDIWPHERKLYINIWSKSECIMLQVSHNRLQETGATITV
jgi:hypothetical protein